MDKPPIIVVYKKSNRSNSKIELMVIENELVDNIISINKKKEKPIPDKYIILEIGVGKSFIKRYKKKYRLNGVKK